MERFAPSLVAFTFLFLLTTEPGCLGQTLNSVCSGADLRGLIDFQNGLNDPENRLSSWKGSNCCKWRGISCDNVTGAVISIDLHNPYPASFSSASPSRYGFWNLSGKIRSSLLQLKSLQYLDLSHNTFGQVPIPEFFGSLTSLQYLNLSTAGFGGPVPANLGNLTRLQTLDISSDFTGLTAATLDWMSGLVSLKHLEMSYVDLSLVGSNWANVLKLLPLLTEVHLSDCSLSGPISNLDHANFTSLSVLDLSYNPFNSQFPSWLLNISSLTYIDLSVSSLYGRIPLGLSELPNLRYLNLFMNNNLSASCYKLFQGSWPKIEDLVLGMNKLHGRLPSSIGKLCNLRSLDLESNNLTGTLPEVLEPTTCFGHRPFPRLMHLEMSFNNLSGTLPEWLGQIGNLVELSLDGNSIAGPIPSSLGNLRNLTNLSLGYNFLNGTLPDTLGELSQLLNRAVSFNDLSGFITEAHFAKLKNLKFLFLDSNFLIFNISPSWTPPFQGFM